MADVNLHVGVKQKICCTISTTVDTIFSLFD